MSKAFKEHHNASKHPHHTLKYLEALILSIGVFVIGFGAGYWFYDAYVNKVDNQIDDLNFNLYMNEMMFYVLTDSDYCGNVVFKNLTALLDDIGEKLTILETREGYDDENVISLKKKYFLLELKHLQFVESYNKRCNTSYNIILYFYSNEKCDKCKDQGYVLSYIKKKYSRDVVIYSFDLSYSDYLPIMYLQDKYNITLNDLPVVVVNHHVLKGYQDAESIEQYLFLKS